MKRVAVTGIGAVTPIGCDIPRYWDALKNGVCGIAEIRRFDAKDLRVKVAAELKDFDPLLYMDKSEVRRNDPFVHYAMAAAAQAVQDAGICGKVDAERFGVYFGSGVGGFEAFINEHNNFQKRGASRVSPLFITRMISNMAAGNIAIQYGAKGSCLCVTTACATASTAIGEAYRAIKAGYADAIIAGGTDAAISPLAVAGFQNCMALSESADPENACLPFDARRSGFVMGEGAGALILEEYEHAVQRGAKIYAEVTGYGATCDAFHVTAPEASAQQPARAIRECLAEMPQDILAEELYVNAHGTGTQLNDKTETEALRQVFGENAEKLHISSTKSMTGHLLGAAGAIEAIAAILALQHQTVPPTVHYAVADAACDLDYTPNRALQTRLSAAISTSLGFGGHNVCLGFGKGGETI